MASRSIVQATTTACIAPEPLEHGLLQHQAGAQQRASRFLRQDLGFWSCVLRTCCGALSSFELPSCPLAGLPHSRCCFPGNPGIQDTCPRGSRTRLGTRCSRWQNALPGTHLSRTHEVLQSECTGCYPTARYCSRALRYLPSQLSAKATKRIAGKPWRPKAGGLPWRVFLV